MNILLFLTIFFQVDLSSLKSENSDSRIRIVCISDTHSKFLPPIPDGDILIHAGDFTIRGSIAEIQKFNKYLGNKHITYSSFLSFKNFLKLSFVIVTKSARINNSFRTR